jgi:hypothetical protein
MLSHLFAAKHSISQQLHNIGDTIVTIGDDIKHDEVTLRLIRAKSELEAALNNIDSAIELAKVNRTFPLVPPAPADRPSEMEYGDE